MQELRVLKLAAVGCPSKEIAARLEISEATVKRHLTKTYRKLRAQNRAAATAIALMQGLIRLPSPSVMGPAESPVGDDVISEP